MSARKPRTHADVENPTRDTAHAVATRQRIAKLYAHDSGGKLTPDEGAAYDAYWSDDARAKRETEGNQ